MGRKTLAIALAAFSLPLLAAPAMAQSKGVNCMRVVYSEEQRAELAELGPEISIAGSDIEHPAYTQIGNLAIAAVESCADQRGWSARQKLYAAMFELGRMNEIAYRASGQLSEDELRRLDDALATGNRDRLWRVLENGVVGGMGQNSAPVSDSDAMLLGTFLLGAGFDIEDEGGEDAEKVGLLLGFMALQRMGRREFANLN